MNKVAIVFPGQGSQFSGMGKELCEEFLVARKTFQEASEYLGFDIGKLCFEGSMMDLNRLENMFPAILTASVALFRVYMDVVGIEPTLTAGHSLGEYAALVSNGGMLFENALKIVRLRALLAKDSSYAEPGTMTVINGIDRLTLESECKKISDKGIEVGIACYNSNEQFVVSGKNEGIYELEENVIRLGAQFTPMLMSPPMHSPLMEAASQKLYEYLSGCHLNTPNWPIISNAYALPYENKKESMILYLVKQMVSPVYWSDTMDYIKSQGIKTLIEMGSQTILTNMEGVEEYGFKIYSFGKKQDRKVLARWKSHAIKTENLAQSAPKSAIISKCLSIAISVPNSNWNMDEYRKGVEEPYEWLQGIQDELDKGIQPNGQQLQKALALLKTILITKRISRHEQEELYYEIGLR